MDLNKLSHDVIASAIEVHRELGPGLLESVYQKALLVELKLRGHECASEVPVKVQYKGNDISNCGYRIDILVNNSLIVELKSVEDIKPVHKKQLLTYLRLTDKRLGLLINFNEQLLKNGITRIVNNFE
jgi:GxxExxY protein